MVISLRFKETKFQVDNIFASKATGRQVHAIEKAIRSPFADWVTYIMHASVSILHPFFCFIIVDNKKNIFEKMVILVNGEIRSDANNLVENDTVLIIFRIVGMSKEQITVTPPCLFNIAVRSGCIHGGNFCDPEYNPPNLAFSWMYYFRPVLMSDDGLTISFTDRSGTRIYGSVTLNGVCVCVYKCVCIDVCECVVIIEASLS